MKYDIFTKTLEELKNRRVLCEESVIIADKGYFKYEYYQKSILDYEIVPLIYPRSNIKLEKIYSLFNYKLEDALDCFEKSLILELMILIHYSIKL